MTPDSTSNETNVKVLSAVLSSRDASFEELCDGDGDGVSDEYVTEIPLEQYVESARLKGRVQDGTYESIQGVNMTPLPCWAVSFQTSRRRVGGSYQTVPRREDGMYKIATSSRGSELQGPGQAKDRWRGTVFEGPCSPEHLYTVVTSTYLVPFAIGHRYVAHLPASIEETESKKRNVSLNILHEYANTEDQSLSSFNNASIDEDTEAIKSWTQQAQTAWQQNKTGNSPDLVTERLNDYNKLAKQQPRRYRVVHTRSRKLYAAVLDPHESTALGLPFGGAEIHSRVNGTVSNTDKITSQGIICDNKLHYINTDSEGEAYWLMGVINSTPFEEKVMEHASGDPPNIYSLPAKKLNDIGLVFDANDERHVEIIDLATELKNEMEKTIKDYISNEKGIDIDAIDDSEAGPEVPKMITTPYTNRFNQDQKLEELDDKVAELIHEATS